MREFYLEFILKLARLAGGTVILSVKPYTLPVAS